MDGVLRWYEHVVEMDFERMLTEIYISEGRGRPRVWWKDIFREYVHAALKWYGHIQMKGWMLKE